VFFKESIYLSEGLNYFPFKHNIF